MIGANKPGIYKVEGFSIIAILIYLSLMTMLLALLMRASTTLYVQLSNYGQSAPEYLKFCAALDCIAHDLYTAPIDTSQWYATTKTELHWKSGEKSIKWRYRNNKLVRIETVSKLQKKKKAKSIAADSITHCSFEHHCSELCLTSITIVIGNQHMNKQIMLERTIVPRTGVSI